MMRTENSDGSAVQWAIAKVLSLWALVGVSTWTEAAAFIGFVYSLCLLSEWVYKKGRSFLAWRAARRRLSQAVKPPTNHGDTTL